MSLAPLAETESIPSAPRLMVQSNIASRADLIGIKFQFAR